MSWLVTIKLPRPSDHDSSRKKTGRCPLPGGGVCTDVTGKHHTALVDAGSAEEAGALFSSWHITRIEEVTLNAETRGGTPLTGP